MHFDEIEMSTRTLLLASYFYSDIYRHIYYQLRQDFFHQDVHPSEIVEKNIFLFRHRETRRNAAARYGKRQEVHMDEVRAMDDVADEGEEGEGECEMCTLAHGNQEYWYPFSAKIRDPFTRALFPIIIGMMLQL